MSLVIDALRLGRFVALSVLAGLILAFGVVLAGVAVAHADEPVASEATGDEAPGAQTVVTPPDDHAALYESVDALTVAVAALLEREDAAPSADAAPGLVSLTDDQVEFFGVCLVLLTFLTAAHVVASWGAK